MNRWFQKGNARRWYRIDMPVRVFILPRSSIRDREIYATGVDYFPPSIKHSISDKTYKTKLWISKIQEQKELVTVLFEEVMEFIEFFGYCTSLISEGRSPKSETEYWLKLSHHQKGFQTIEALKVSSPRTYQYFKLIEQKYLTFLNSLVSSVEKSTPEHFEVDASLPYGFKIDEIMAKFEDPKFAKIPLIQALHHLSNLMDVYMGVYRKIIDDNYLKQFPELWKTQTANVSASGLGIMMEKRFKFQDKVDVYFYFSDANKVLHFEASVVDIRTIEDTFKERIALNFEFPDGKSQNYLQSEIEKFEIKECMELDLTPRD
ncbi:PilZ domain-containing protein [Thiosulfativibrio zosterae]|uniref:PilZ domain-containing protein n=1 Tax=Thiosulfativibrio zosterae TaxID=2675053 RepID=A0A6F8PKT5_9GAMM|nr:PilZ domain-containing protein [Thiosulfativibrio zosterae]BBP42610.1 hypothetical protein THMIRHAT_03560 [Thiosulfativibrio zosterae]